ASDSFLDQSQTAVAVCAIQMRQRMMRSLVLGLPVVGAIAAIGIQLSRVPWPSAGFWGSHGSWVVGAIVSAGLIPVVQTSISEFGEKRRNKTLVRENRLRTVLASSLVVLVRDCGAPFDLTGVQVFLVTGLWWRVKQTRVAKIRLSPAPASGVSWSKGKGVI